MGFSSLKRTFTLIEMLIVVVIIGILAAALIPRLKSTQEKTRDSKRKVDLTQIANAILIHKIDHGSFPAAANDTIDCDATFSYPSNEACGILSTSPGNWFPGLSGYMTSVPIDPVNINTAYFSATYTSFGAAYGSEMYAYFRYGLGAHFIVMTNLESSTDPARCASSTSTDYWLTHAAYVPFNTSCKFDIVSYGQIYERNDTTN